MSNKSEILAIAEAVLEGKVSVIEASRKLVSLHYEENLENEEYFKVFWVVDSETDHLPMGRHRENYSAEKLLEIDNEVRAYEQFHKKAVILACEHIVEKYGRENLS